MLSRISVRASRARLESIKRVALDVRSDERFQAASIGDVDTDREQSREVVSDPNIFEEANRGPGVKLDQNIDVARACGLAARERAEQRRMANPTAVQLRLVSAQRGDDLFPIDAGARPTPVLNLTHRGSFFCHPQTRPADPLIAGSDRAVAVRNIPSRSRPWPPRSIAWISVTQPDEQRGGRLVRRILRHQSALEGGFQYRLA